MVVSREVRAARLEDVDTWLLETCAERKTGVEVRIRLDAESEELSACFLLPM